MGGIASLDMLPDRFGPADVNLPATPGPEQKLYEPFDVSQGIRVDDAIGYEHVALPTADGSVG